MKIGVLGGTFNPIHNAHLQMAALARDALGLDRVLLMVAADPPHKTVDGHVDARTRFTMTQLGCAGLPRIEASELELSRAGKSYTADTLEQLKALTPGAELVWIMGSDMLRDLPHWYEPKRIAALAQIAYVPRSGQEADDAGAAALLREGFGARVVALPAEADEISSTMLRERLYAGAPVDGLMPAATLLYCYEAGLYFPAALRDLMARVRATLTIKRWRHSAGCAIAAARLAESWGASLEKARLAAYLHDCAKNLPVERLCVLSGDDTGIPAVQHAFAGAVLAKTLYGVSDDEVLRAIRRHCTGERDMGLLDKIVFLADAIEPAREYSGVTELRRSVAKGPDAAMLFALTHSAEHIRKARDVEGMHPATGRAIEYFQRRTKEEED